MLVHPKIDPVALQLGPLAIHWYGLTYLVAFGLFMALAMLRRRAEYTASHHHAVEAHPTGAEIEAVRTTGGDR